MLALVVFTFKFGLAAKWHHNFVFSKSYKTKLISEQVQAPWEQKQTNTLPHLFIMMPLVPFQAMKMQTHLENTFENTDECWD